MVQSPEVLSPRMRRMRNRKVRRRVTHHAATAVVVVGFLVSAVLTACVFTLHLGIRPVLTGSMEPDYGPGAVLLTERVPTSSLKPGMIVLFVPPGGHAEYAHRITSVTGKPSDPVITTKGDANKAADPWHARINSNQVSRVVGSAPGIGRVIVAIRGTGQILLAVIGGVAAAWASMRWALKSSNPRPRRMTTGGV
jgi:signal peptidase I